MKKTLTMFTLLFLSACGPITGGEPACEDGATKDAEDGCNTCTCTDGGWACTEIACDPGNQAPNNSSASCTDGDTKDADDGCNSCTCSDGYWACTERACLPDNNAPSECVDGDTKPAEDGCNSCTCSDGYWACTEIACGINNDPSVCNEGDTKDAEDGCNTCTCTEGGWACTELACLPDNNAPDDIADITVCPDDIDMMDGYDLNEVRIVGDVLEADVSFSGGCEEHDFTLCYRPAFLESFPVQAQVVLRHDANNDPCEAYPSETRKFNLDSLKKAYISGYQPMGEATVILRFEGHPVSADYTFE